jgi:hypothetical protein
MARGDVQKERRQYKLIRRVLGWTSIIALIWWLSTWNSDTTVGFSTPWGFLLPFPLLLFLLSAVGLFVYLRFIASFNCPYCKKMVDLNTDWECFYCHYVHHNPIWFTIFHRCRNLKCRKKPKIWACKNVNCAKPIYLLSSAPQLASVQQPNVSRFPGNP